QLDVSYFPVNNSITFNISAASVLPNVSVSAIFYANVYGMQPINTTFALCDLFGGILCPLPEYNFIGQDSLQLPSSIQVAKEVPGIAYVIPDLEAFAQITLVEVGTQNVLACVQATLSNGWSMRQYAVEWSTAAIALLALAFALWQSASAGILALAPIRLLDILYLFQTIAASGLLGLNYPSVYTSFTLNFSWALGLFPTTAASRIQNSINHMRNLTGADVSDASGGGTVPLVNRKLSPYNVPSSSSSAVKSLSLRSLHDKVSALPRLNLADPNALSLARRTPVDASLLTRDVVVVTSESSNVLEAGVPIYTNYIGIATANTFMTIFLVFLMLTAIVLAFMGLGYAIWFYMMRSERGRRQLDKIPGLKDGYPAFARSWGLRVALCTFFPVTIFAFYQWTLKDSWLSILLSVILLMTVLALVLIPMYIVFRPYLPAFLSRPSSSTPSQSWTPYVAPFQPSRYYYIVPLFLAMFVKSCIVGFGDAHGMTQAILFLVVDVLVFASLIVLKPYRTRHADVLMGFLAIVRIICSGLSVAFSQSLSLAPIPRVVVGIIMAVVFSIAVLVMFINTLVNMGLWRLFKYVVCCGRRRGRAGDKKLVSNPDPTEWNSSFEKDRGETDAEKEAAFTPGVSEHSFTRPGNPTPPTVGTLTPPASAHTQQSLYTESSETTLGEQLPRRWSFQHSRPPSHTETGSPSSYSYARRSVTPSPSTPTSGLPSRHSRHPSSNAPHSSPIEERYSREGFA
ncbi:TRP-domain-containing protein, partial [Amylocystis lapponica]